MVYLEMLGKLFRRRKAKAQASNAPSDNDIFQPLSIDNATAGLTSTTNVNNAAVRSCVRVIVSRALEVPIVLPKGYDERPYLDVYDWRQFWRTLFEKVLYDGVALVYVENNGRLHIANNGTLVQGDGMKAPTWSLNALQNTLVIRPQMRDASEVAAIGWSAARQSPWETAQGAANAYTESFDDLYQQAKFERRITSEVEVNKAFSATPDQLEEQLSDITEGVLKSGRKYQSAFLGYGVKYAPRFFAGSPPHKERIETSLAGVARVYGVPLQLLMVQAGQRMDIEQLDANLMRDAVLPLLHDTTAALSRITMKDVMIDDTRVALPTRTGITGNAMTLSQTGVMTINEIREVLGLPPIDGGDVLPQTAGAAERDNDGGDEKESKDVGNDEANDM